MAYISGPQVRALHEGYSLYNICMVRILPLFSPFVLMVMITYAIMPLAFGTNKYLVGDINHDGIVDKNDVGLLYLILYESKTVRAEWIASMDFNGDNQVDVDDLVELRKAVWDKQAPFYRSLPIQMPTLIPRNADFEWFVPKRERAKRSLSRRISALKLQIQEGYIGLNPSREITQELFRLSQDINQAVHFGFSSTIGSSFCEQLATMQEVVSIDSWLREKPEGRKYLEGCVQRLPDTPRRMQGSFVDSTCSLMKAQINTNFWISKKNGKLSVTVPISIEFDPDISATAQSKFFERWTQAKRCARDFWSRYGVDFSLDISDSGERKFVVYSGSGRNSEKKLYIDSNASDVLCSWIVHEAGHGMGLPDDYDEPDMACKGRHPEDQISIMGESATRGIRYVEWRPRHLEQMFGSICGQQGMSLG